MPRELVIGADGFIGGRLRTLLGPQCEGTSRRNPTMHPFHHLDLLDFEVAKLPEATAVWICAGVNGAMACEGRAESYRVNVDAPIRLARHYRATGAFTVWISSTTVEWSNSAYARQKSLSEVALSSVPLVGIVRAGRVLHSNVDDLCQLLAKIGRERRAGVTLWGTDEQPYAK